jgi:type I restriction enzyme S subunit
MRVELTKDWKVVKLAEVAEKITKGGTPTSYGYLFQNKGINFVKIENISDGKLDLKSISNFISDEAHLFLLKSQLKENDLLYSIAGTIGKTCIVKKEYLPANTNQALAIIRLSPALITPHYLRYQLDSLITRKMKAKARGGAMNNISLEDMRNLEIFVAPLSEQQCIVAKLEELLSELEKGKEQLHTALDQLKVYRQAVLKYAFEGKLTNKNVEDDELPKGWKWAKIIDVAKKITDGEHFRPKTEGKGIPFLSAKDVRDNGVSFEQPLYISEKTAAKALQRCNPVRGDILIVSRGATVGRMCIVKTDKIFCLLGSVILIKVNENLVSEYLTYILKSPTINQKLVAVSGATAQQAIYLRDIKNVEIPFPPIEEQHRIVDEIECRLSVADKLEETITASLQQSETLRQSILKKAFEGKLV